MVCPYRRPFPEFANLNVFEKPPRSCVFRWNKTVELSLDFPLSAPVSSIDAEMRLNVSLAVLGSPTCAASRSECNRHPNLTEVFSLSSKRRWVGKIIPLQKESGAERVFEHQR